MYSGYGHEVSIWHRAVVEDDVIMGVLKILLRLEVVDKDVIKKRMEAIFESLYGT
jgi:hypothetical protein